METLAQAIMVIFGKKKWLGIWLIAFDSVFWV
jgi:hypothetical protein